MVTGAVSMPRRRLLSLQVTRISLAIGTQASPCSKTPTTPRCEVTSKRPSRVGLLTWDCHMKEHSMRHLSKAPDPETEARTHHRLGASSNSSRILLLHMSPPYQEVETSRQCPQRLSKISLDCRRALLHLAGDSVHQWRYQITCSRQLGQKSLSMVEMLTLPANRASHGVLAAC